MLCLHNTHLEGPWKPILHNLSIVKIFFWNASHKKNPAFGRQAESQHRFRGMTTSSHSQDWVIALYLFFTLYLPSCDASQMSFSFLSSFFIFLFQISFSNIFLLAGSKSKFSLIFIPILWSNHYIFYFYNQWPCFTID